jgi:hypothetical protein
MCQKKFQGQSLGYFMYQPALSWDYIFSVKSMRPACASPHRSGKPAATFNYFNVYSPKYY